MARRNPRREALLAEVAKRHRAAGQKVSRLERQGVRVRKAELDPRRTDYQQLSTPQLHTYLRQLNRFTDRSNNYVAGLRGEPIRRSTWNAYRKAERAYNAKVQRFEQSINDIRLPASPGARALTIGERRAMLEQNRFPKPGGHWRVYQERHGTPGGFSDEESVRNYQAALERWTRDSWEGRAMGKVRKTLEKMLTESGDRDVWEDVRHLDNRELMILVDHTNFMQNVGYRYEEKKVRDSNNDPSDNFSTVFDSAGNNVRNLSAWARTDLKQQLRGTVRSDYTDTRAGAIPVQRKRYDPTDTTAGAIKLPYTDTNAGSIDLPGAGKRKRRK